MTVTEDLRIRVEPNEGDPYIVIQQQGLYRSYLALYWHATPEELEQLAEDLRAARMPETVVLSGMPY